MVGCCCEDDYKDIVWFELSKGKEQQCDCGNYFKLIDYDPLDPNIKPKYGMGFGSGFGSIYYQISRDNKSTFYIYVVINYAVTQNNLHALSSLSETKQMVSCLGLV